MTERNTAVVTGGGAGIGAAIVAAMLDRDYAVVSLAREKPALAHPSLEAVELDLLDTHATERAAADIAARHQVSHLIHCAGVTRHKPVAEASPDDLRDLAQLHLGAALILLQACLPGMKQRQFGRVVMISSRAALGTPGRTAYSATKAGIVGMGRTWALELAPFGITVNMVAPGPIQGTAMFHDLIPAGSEREAALAAAIPVKRLGRPEDVVNAVMFFAARESSFVTGQTLYVCGGSSVGTLTI
jgi:NAD(P)-dependent dehydrogenase (short-subunit alcohol dehydrogenase family)